MKIKNYTNILCSKRLHELLLKIFNEKTLPLIQVKRTTKLNATNCATIMAYIAKNEDIEDAISFVLENSVVEGKPKLFGDLLEKFALNGKKFFHGVNVSKLLKENGGYPEVYNLYQEDLELERILDSFEKAKDEPKEYVPAPMPKPAPEGKDFKLEDFIEDEFDKNDPFEEQKEIPAEETPKEEPKQAPIPIPAFDKKEVLEEVQSLILKEMESYRMVIDEDAQKLIMNCLESKTDEIVARLAKIKKPDKIVVVNGEERKLPQELYHKQFDMLLQLIANHINIYLYGEAGDGKTHLIRQVANALKMNFYTQTPSDVIGLLGYSDINGEFQETPFTLWCKNGGVMYMSEFDNVGDAVLSINTALANGFITINKTRVGLHKNCVFVADGNTKGNGANAVYCGRNAIDGATLDRFLFIELEHDDDLELSLSGDNKEWMSFIKEFRRFRDELLA